ncbi:DUF4862 family protein [Buchananella felis]|uniref:DUF4862 family protein n=1 Tax=Buchananella felis TaxID=3231492 RepID=UPI0035281C48
MLPPYVVGAYAAEPAPREPWYEALAAQDWVCGLEIPWPGDLAENTGWLAKYLPARFDSTVITAIPGTMVRMGADPVRGLASPDQEGRKRALADVAELRDGLARLCDATGFAAARWVHLHSAPRQVADAAALAASLEELSGWDWCGASPVIEHCDRFVAGQPPQKGFLPISAELDAAAAAGTGVSMNWGRSAIEARSGAVVAEHIAAAARRGLLRGVMFSGAGEAENYYGKSWEDLHLPLAADEPTSLLDDAEVLRCAAAWGEQAPAYVGAKIQARAEWDVERRLSAARRAYDVLAAREA